MVEMRSSASARNVAGLHSVVEVSIRNPSVPAVSVSVIAGETAVVWNRCIRRTADFWSDPSLSQIGVAGRFLVKPPSQTYAEALASLVIQGLVAPQR
jgi:hypothetical protein